MLKVLSLIYGLIYNNVECIIDNYRERSIIVCYKYIHILIRQRTKKKNKASKKLPQNVALGYIYIYGEKLSFIAISIVARYQQVNVTPESVQLCMRSFMDQKSNFLTWETIFPTPPPTIQGMIKLQSPVALAR